MEERDPEELYAIFIFEVIAVWKERRYRYKSYIYTGADYSMNSRQF